MTETSNRWAVAAAMSGMLLAPTALVLGLLVGARGPDASDVRPTPIVGEQTTVAPWTNVVASRTASTVAALDRHQVMLEQMRVNVTPQMVQAMNVDPLAHSPGDVTEFEQHAADIDRMLARNR